MNPPDSKGITYDDGDETLATISRHTRSSGCPERLFDGAIRANAAEERRKKASEDAVEAERVADEAEKAEKAEERDSGGESDSRFLDGISINDPNASSDLDETAASGQARLKGIP
ncbi:unnamed protein product [Microthlaspi erraticum]|uniref:Uncharacterized protein n=1 Tax=Microthlaspi erraticum TaxID=1685480 RepID=A0A6D2JZF1_9BRAS|nr:unnamed protein product [Microthlaspi erraticum]